MEDHSFVYCTRDECSESARYVVTVELSSGYQGMEFELMLCVTHAHAFSSLARRAAGREWSVSLLRQLMPGSECPECHYFIEEGEHAAYGHAPDCSQFPASTRVEPGEIPQPPEPEIPARRTGIQEEK